MTIYKENIVGYIGGFVVRKMLKSLHCSTCAEALLGRDNHHERYLTLTHIKDNGGLIIPSDDVFKILKKAESFFVSYISGRPGDDVQISRVPHVKNILSNKIQQEPLRMLIRSRPGKHFWEHFCSRRSWSRRSSVFIYRSDSSGTVNTIAQLR